MYVLERSVLDLIPPGEEVSIERDVFPRLVGDGLHGLLLDGYWMDIGTPERYLQASWDILEGRVETRVEPTAPGVLVDAGRRGRGRRDVGPRAVVGAGCRVGGRRRGARTRSCSTAARSARAPGSAARSSPPGAEVARRGRASRARWSAQDERVPADG